MDSGVYGDNSYFVLEMRLNRYCYAFITDFGAMIS
jgi:hypothetical protein